MATSKELSPTGGYRVWPTVAQRDATELSRSTILAGSTKPLVAIDVGV
jgi:hypothetical protein